jgi:hypothetical protein
MAVLEILPPLTATSLAHAEYGSLVIYGDDFAFVTYIKDQEDARILAIFAGDKKKFIYAAGLPAHTQLARIGGNIVIEPDFERGTVEVRRVELNDTSANFIRDQDVYGMAEIGGGIPLPHMFNLQTGRDSI